MGKFLPLASTAAGAALLGRLGQHGYATRRDSVAVGFTAVAAPVRDEHGKIVGALCIAGPSVRMPDAAVARLGRLVAEQALAASREISAGQ